MTQNILIILIIGASSSEHFLCTKLLKESQKIRKIHQKILKKVYIYIYIYIEREIDR